MPVNIVTSPSFTQHKDLRAISVPHKREKDQSEKRSQHARLGHSTRSTVGCELGDNLISKTDGMHIKSQPSKPWVSNIKISKMAKSGWSSSKVNGRPNTRNNANIDDTDGFLPGLSHSMLPNPSCSGNKPLNTEHTTSLGPGSPDPLYSFDNKGPSPGIKGRSVELEKLVENAEKEWEGKMTEKIVEGEYEVLDVQGENVAITKKGKKIMKQKPKISKNQKSSEVIEEDDGFELI